ncbi:MAG: MATE family efflux transporter [Fusobacteria bacterium]|nr:MAG: MATE family efflux transporter [Fusobacteriota bacterium]
MQKKLGTEKILPLLIKFSVPATIGILITMIYNITDRYFIGQYVGGKGLGALAITFPLTILILGISMLFTMGGASSAGIKLGEKDKDGAEKVLGTTVFWIIVIGGLLSIVSLLFLPEILTFLGASKGNIGEALDYNYYLLPFAMFQISFISLNGFLRVEGNPMLSMKVNLFGAGLNILLDYIFIAHMNMGMIGAAIGTAAASVIPSFYMIAHLYKSKVIKLDLNKIKPNKKIMKRITDVGMGAFYNQLLSGITIFIMNKNLNIYGGDLAIAAAGIVMTMRNFMNISFIGFNQGRQPILSYNYGAKNFDRVKETYILSTKIVLLIVIVLTLLIVGGAKYVAAFFVSDVQLIELTSSALVLNLILMFSTSLYFSTFNYYQAVGKGKKNKRLLVIRVFFLTIPLLFILPKLMGLNGVWLAVPIADTIAMIFALYSMKGEFRELDSELDLAKGGV